MTSPNWFVAFPFEGTFAANLPAPPPRFRLLAPEDLHVTVAFLGACGEAAALRGYERITASPPSVEVSLGAVVPMGPSRYSALSALLVLGRREIEAMMSAFRDVVADAAGARREERPPKAHVTIARPSRGASAADRAIGESWANALDLRPRTTTIGRIALYTWSEDRTQRQFRIVRERPLARNGAHVGS